MRRSTLQRKDREELTRIATALGRKPPSRARKGEIIDLILELAAGGNGESPAAGGNGRGGGVAAAADTGEGRADADDAAAAGDAPGAADASGAGDAGDAGDAGEAPAAGDAAGAADASAAGDASGGDAAGAESKGAEQAAAGGEAETGADAGERQGGEQRHGGEQRQGGEQRHGGEQRQGGDQPESGNRRRRRRGRNRDRDREREDEHVPAEPVPVAGYLELRDEGYGFVRTKGYLPSKEDAYVPVKMVRQYGLRKGDHITGTSRPAGRKEKNPALLTIESVNGDDPDKARNRPRFEDLTPLFPDEKLVQEMPDDPMNMTARIIDLIAPIGKGQRGLIVSPPKAGKTTVMKNIARSIETNNPEVHVIVLLVDERPEEVTDMRRWLQRGEVVASTFDRPSDEHTLVAEMTIERAKRMVEYGKDVCIILDGITRLARAYNLAAPATGRIMSGGIDTGALYPPKKFFGAARNVEEGGSLTILATALVETGSKMDEVIFEEFKGTGNMELRLDRRAAERRIYPAIDVDASSTRHEELLFERKQLQQVWKLRRVLSGLASDGGSGAGLELLIDRLKTFRTNDEFLAEVARGPSMG
ncbi:MAG: transcription termination factor Rho [Actinomyces sp.]|nr:MAG: transcription termination factor Rho [Actinomyces sp.]